MSAQMLAAAASKTAGASKKCFNFYLKVFKVSEASQKLRQQSF